MRKILAVAFAGLLLTSLNLMAAPDAPKTLTVLNTIKAARQPGTIWRYFETWQSDVASVDGKLVNIDVFDARIKGPGLATNKGYSLKEAKRVMGSAFPPAQWRAVDFDDSGWVRNPGPFPNYYRSLAQISMRGKFEVSDPSAVNDLSLTVKFQGGVVAYLNGVEVGRGGMPDGPIDQTTLATAYPPEATTDSKGHLIPQTTEYPGRIYGASEDLHVNYSMNTQEIVDRFKSRARSMDVKIPAKLLAKGVNVLAIEVHHAVAEPIMFTSVELSGGNTNAVPNCWNRAAIEDIELTTTASPSAITPNTSRPTGVQLWQEETLANIDSLRYGDPTEAARPVRLSGLKNGVCSGQVIVGSNAAIAGLKASITDLKGDAIIPASSISIAFAGINNDALNPSAAASIPAAKGNGAIQRIWVTVPVPRDVPSGKYTGTLTVNLDNEKPLTVPVELKVVGDWVLPDPQNFTTFMAVHESADSVAMQYKTPLWSDQHWKNLDKIYEMLGQIATKDIYLPIVAKTHLANEQSMVRWVKQPDGSFKYDYTVFERYLDTALKHLGKVPVVCIYLEDYGFRIADAKMAPIIPTVTQVDSATGEISEIKPPEWGTPESKTFWKPVIDGAIDIITKRGLQKSIMFGMGANNWVLPACCSDLKSMYPDIPWVNRTHYYSSTVGEGAGKQRVGLSSVVGGVISIFYDPDVAQHYGWKSPDLIVNFPRFGNVPGAVFDQTLPSYRIYAESALISGGARWRSVELVRGVGHIGADFWPVLKDAHGDAQNMGNRYVFWHSLSIAEVMPAVLGAGTDGPVATTRFNMMRESLQEAEARIYVQNALLDKAQSAKLDPQLVQRCNDLCQQRTDIIRYFSQFCEPGELDDYAKVFDYTHWRELSEKLYQAASDIHKALGEK